MAKIKLVVSATIEETFSDFIISRKTKGLAEKTLQSYQSQFQAVARHMDVKMDIAMLPKADLDAMIISMRDASLSPNSINSYTRTLKSFFSWCNEQGMASKSSNVQLGIPLLISLPQRLARKPSGWRVVGKKNKGLVRIF